MAELPKQVLKQQEEVAELERQMYGDGEPTIPPEGQPDPIADEPFAEEVQPKAVTEPVPTSETRPPEDKSWEERYKALQGMFNAEVPRLQSQNKELLQQLHAMQLQLGQLQLDQLQRTPTPEQKPELLVTDADRDMFGADTVDMTSRVAQQVMREHLAPLQAELAKRDIRISQLEAALTKTSGDVNTMTFEQQLNLAVPNFSTFNSDPAWISWLNETDPLTGEPRRAYAEYVYSQGNVAKVKAVVDLFNSTKATETSNAQRDQRQTELSRQVQPARNATSSTPSSGERFYTEAEAGRLFDKVRVLNTEGRYEEAAKLDADLSNAYVQGRVRG